MTQPTPKPTSADAVSVQPPPIRTHRSTLVTPRLVKHCDNYIFGAVGDKETESIWIQIKQDLITRNELGIQTYGTPLYTFNGRDPLIDAYQEILDAAKYYQQYTMEDGKSTDLMLTKLLGLLFDLKRLLVLQAMPDPSVQAG